MCLLRELGDSSKPMTRSFRPAAPLIPLAFCLLANVSHAQTETQVGVDDLESDAKPTAAATQTDADSEVIDEARRRFDRGVQLYNDEDFALALIEFERAYDLVSNYRVLYNIGQVSIQLRKYARARTALERYLATGRDEIDAERLNEVNADVEMLKARTARLMVRVNEPEAQIFLDGELLGLSPLAEPVLVDAGTHVLAVKRSGFSSREKSIQLAGGDDISIDVPLEAQRLERTVEKQTIVVQNRSADNDATWKWVGWGTAGVLAAGAVATGVFGLTAVSELEDLRNTSGVSHEELGSAQSRARRMFIASDILAGTALIAAGVSLYLTIGPSDSDEDAGVDLAVGPTSLTLSGRF